MLLRGFHTAADAAALATTSGQQKPTLTHPTRFSPINHHQQQQQHRVKQGTDVADLLEARARQRNKGRALERKLKFMNEPASERDLFFLLVDNNNNFFHTHTYKQTNSEGSCGCAGSLAGAQTLAVVEETQIRGNR